MTTTEFRGEVWSLCRDALTRGGAIDYDSAMMGRCYEVHSACLDSAASDFANKFDKLFQEVIGPYNEKGA